MVADAPETERLAKVEKDVAWIKLIGSAMAVALGAIFWQLYSLNAKFAAMDAKLGAMGDGRNPCRDRRKLKSTKFF